MSDQNVTITETAKLSLSISSWWHVVVIIIAMCACYFGLQAKMEKAIDQSTSALDQSTKNNEQIMSMQSDIRSVREDVGWFRKQYEADMTRYIRETPKR